MTTREKQPRQTVRGDRQTVKIIIYRGKPKALESVRPEKEKSNASLDLQ